MMRIAFYAPLKPPDHPVPSGDRTVARLLRAALREAGHVPEIACRLRTYDRGDPMRQKRLRDLSRRVAETLVPRYLTGRRPLPDAWMTYHLYYKAPDWIGPIVSEKLGIPYIVVEASFAEKRGSGPYAVGHDGVTRALDRADVVIGLNPEDQDAVLRRVPNGRYVTIPPFSTIPCSAMADKDGLRRQVARKHDIPLDSKWLLSVGMMRSGDKEASYNVLARALEGLPRPGWTLLVAGDGPRRDAIRAKLDAACSGARVVWLGALDRSVLSNLYRACDLMVWPAVNEAFGMAILEAQLAGLPVLAGDRIGVRAIVRDGKTGALVTAECDQALASALKRLLGAPELLGNMARAAREEIPRAHGLASASRRLHAILNGLVRGDACGK